MIRDDMILDLVPWALPLGALFAQVLNPASPAMLHRSLAEQAASLLEQAVEEAAEAPDEEAPWRALRTGDALILSLDDGFAFAHFDGPSLVSLRVEREDGQRWTAIFTGRDLSSFGFGGEGGPDPELKVALFEEERLLWSHSFYPDGRDADDRDHQGALEEARQASSGTADTGEGGGFGLGAALGGAALGGLVLGAGLGIARRTLARKARERASRPSAPPPPPPPPSPSSAPEPPAAWRLVCTAGPLSGTVFPIQDGLVLGREKGVDVVVEDRAASRRHAELKVQGDRLLLTDLGSSNGTWMDERPLSQPVLLQGGEIFGIGLCRFRVERAVAIEPTAAPSIAPPPVPQAPPLGTPPACPRCRKPVEPDWLFCKACGAGLRSPRTCARCGTAIPVDGRFCPACGTPA